ncbi:MAG: dipeptidase [Rhizobiaceae bacterium]
MNAARTTTSRQRAEAEAIVSDVLDKVPLVDAHNDTPHVIKYDASAKGDVASYRLDTRRSGDTDIPRMRDGRIGAQVWAAFTESGHAHPATETLELIDIIHAIQDTHADVFRPALRSSDIMEAHREGKIASLLAVEGGVGAENKLAPLRIWYGAGMRLMTLCHNGSLDWVDSATDVARNGGLSPFGREVVRELNRLGVMVDCSHTSNDTTRQVLEMSSAPVVISHSNAIALCQSPRNVPDDILDKLAANDGIIMATFITDFVSEEVRQWMLPVRKLFAHVFSASERKEIVARHERENGARPRATVAQVADHIEYMARKVGTGRIGIGSDFCGAPVCTAGLEDVSCIKNLLVELAMRGWEADHLANVAGLNFIRVFRAVEEESLRLRHRKAEPLRASA